MRQIKRISFFIYSCLLLAAGFYAHIRYEEFLYPQYVRESQKSQVGREAYDSAQEVTATPTQISFDAELVTIIENLSSKRREEQKEMVPAKYVGMDRETFLRCMEDEVLAPTLSERKLGLVSIEVQSFSPQRVVILKSYKNQDVAASFYVGFSENMVVIYEEDKSSVYMRTSIDGRLLPVGIRDEISHGKVIDSREALEAFLEEYNMVPASE